MLPDFGHGTRLAASLNGEKKAFSFSPRLVGRRSAKDVATDEASEDATTAGQRTLYGFRAAYVFDRLSRDLQLSLCVFDGFPCATLEAPLESIKHIIAQLLCSVQRCR
jgi:hypothetical protein